MRRTTAASIVALGSFVLPASAQQTIIYGDPAFQPQGQVFQPQQPFGNQQILIDPITGQPLQQPQFQPQPNFGQPLPQPQQNFNQPQPQVNFGQPLPQPGQSYNPAQPAITTVPQTQATRPLPAQPNGTVPYYDNLGARTQPPSPPSSATPRDSGSSLPTATAAQDAQSEDTASSNAVPFGPGSDRAPRMSAELSELLSVGERYRAASPGFLEDLKALAARYSEPLPQSAVPVAADPFASDFVGEEGDPALSSTDPAPEFGPETDLSLNIDPLTDVPGSVDPVVSGVQPVTVVPPLDPGSTTFAYIEDDFTDGDIDNNPSWRVRQGDWAVDPQYGLRAKAPTQVSDAPIKPKELLKVLLTGDTPESDGSSGPQAALIEAQTSVGNAFSFAARVVDHAGTGTAHFIMHQGGSNWLGYRLELRSGPQPVVVLTRRGSNGYKDITKVAAPGFTKGEQHELRWARLSDGQMLVILNGRPIITSRDTVFREDWKGFAFFNAGGDVSIRALRISAPVER